MQQSNFSVPVVKEETVSTPPVDYHHDSISSTISATKRPRSSSMPSDSDCSESTKGIDPELQLSEPAGTSGAGKRLKYDDDCISELTQIVIQKEILQTLREIRDVQKQRLEVDQLKLEFIKSQTRESDPYLKV